MEGARKLGSLWKTCFTTIFREQPETLFPEIAEIRSSCKKAGLNRVLMSGSGSHGIRIG